MILIAIREAWLDILNTLPLLFLSYLVIAVVETRFKARSERLLHSLAKFGPLIGALLGGIPQCGFSVMATVLFVQRLITPGTLLAVYISTSDEALPLLIAEPARAHIIFPLIGLKIVIGTLAGILVDASWRLPFATTLEPLHEHGCCNHDMANSSEELLLWHPIVHTCRIGAYVFAITALLNILMSSITNDQALLHLPVMVKTLAATVFGLVPNCAASVFITELYLKGMIGFGPMLAGLSAGAGLGLLVLYRLEKRPVALIVTGLLVAISYLAGILISAAGY